MLGWLFGGGADKIIDKVDESILSNEEKMSLFIEYQKATMPQNLARRLLALMLVGSYLFIVLLASLIWNYLPHYSEFLFKVANELLLIPVTTIIGFYFLKRFTMGRAE